MEINCYAKLNLHSCGRGHNNPPNQGIISKEYFKCYYCCSITSKFTCCFFCNDSKCVKAGYKIENSERLQILTKIIKEQRKLR